jgi:hypothetical protein
MRGSSRRTLMSHKCCRSSMRSTKAGECKSKIGQMESWVQDQGLVEKEAKEQNNKTNLN